MRVRLRADVFCGVIGSYFGISLHLHPKLYQTEKAVVSLRIFVDMSEPSMQCFGIALLCRPITCVHVFFISPAPVTMNTLLSGQILPNGHWRGDKTCLKGFRQSDT